MKKSTTALVAMTAGVLLAISVAVPASAVTINTGAKMCASGHYDRQTSKAKYSVEHVIYSDIQWGEYAMTYSNGATYTTRVTSWNGSGGVVFIGDASASRANGVYLSTASIKCV